MAGNQRPFKVWDGSRRNKKSVTVSSLKQLLAKGREKLGIAETEVVHVVLESDGTEVDEEDYFTFLSFNTTLMLLQAGETWRQPGAEAGKDEPDYMMGDGRAVSDRVRQLASGLQREISRIITFSNDDLQELVDISAPDLAQLLGDTEAYARTVQEACQRHLGEREQTTEALDLLKLYHKSRQHSPYVEDEDPKRKKFAHT